MGNAHPKSNCAILICNKCGVKVTGLVSHINKIHLSCEKRKKGQGITRVGRMGGKWGM